MNGKEDFCTATTWFHKDKRKKGLVESEETGYTNVRYVIIMSENC